MSSDIFIKGLIYKIPNKAPEFVKGKISIKVDEFIEFLKQHGKNNWVNIDLNISKSGKPYAKLNTWKKEIEEADRVELKEDEDSDLPF